MFDGDDDDAHVRGEPATTHHRALGEDACRYVFVRSDTPVSPTAANGLASTIRLVVTATTDRFERRRRWKRRPPLPTTPPWWTWCSPRRGVANGNVVEDGISMAFDQYLVGTLTVTKTAAVISDGFSAAGQAKAIPGAIVEYTITVQNNGLVTSGAALTELIPANTTYVAGSTTLNGAARVGRGGRDAVRRWRCDQFARRLPRACINPGCDCRRNRGGALPRDDQLISRHRKANNRHDVQRSGQTDLESEGTTQVPRPQQRVLSRRGRGSD